MSVGVAVSIRRRRFLSLDITGMCYPDEREVKTIDGVTRGEGHSTETLWGHARCPAAPQGCQEEPNGGTAE